MTLHFMIRNESAFKGLRLKRSLTVLAERVCAGEGRQNDCMELSLLLCGDPMIQELNRTYRGKDAPTDVLSFGVAEEIIPAGVDVPRPLGDIIISLDTVAQRCPSEKAGEPDIKRMQQEINLLFCHGLLHLLGWDHATQKDRAAMNARQAEYLGTTLKEAWEYGPPSARGGK